MTVTPEGTPAASSRRGHARPPGGPAGRLQPASALAPEGVVLQPRVADARDEDLLLERPGHEPMTSTSVGLKYRYRPMSRMMSWPGSSSTVTHRWTWSS